MKKRLISLAIVLVVLFTLAIPAYAETDVSEAKKGVSVIAVLVQVDGVNELAGQATCFFVGEKGKAPEYVITNYHVISDYVENGSGELISAVDNSGTQHLLKMLIRVYLGDGSSTEAYVVDYNASQDLAILRLNGTATDCVPLTLACPTESMVGESMYSIGYPSYADSVFLDPTSTWERNDSLVVKGTIGRLITSSGSGTKWIQIPDTQWGNGASGGPLIVDGCVIGTVTGAYESASSTANMCYATDISAAVTMLRNNGISFMLDEGGFNIKALLPYIAIAVGVLVVAGIVVAIILIIKNKKSKNTSETGNTDQNVPPQVRAMLRSYSSQHGGLCVPVSAQGISIGRNPNCAVVFAGNTPGVSGNHCTLSFNSATNTFILTDTKSSYGTYLMNGMRLTPFQPYNLTNGDTFYLGDKANMMKVEIQW